GLLLPPGPPTFPVVVHSFGVFDDPGGIRSSSPSASLRGAAPPPWTPDFSSRRPLLRRVRRPRGDSQLIPLRFAAGGCSSPLDPRLFQSSSTPSECSTTQGGFAAHPPPLRCGGLLLPPGPPSPLGRGVLGSSPMATSIEIP